MNKNEACRHYLLERACGFEGDIGSGMGAVMVFLCNPKAAHSKAKALMLEDYGFVYDACDDG